MPKYRKKPVVIEAEVYREGLEDGFDYQANRPYIETLEGRMFIRSGDYIITGVKGERYPCKPDIFKATYSQEDEGSMNAEMRPVTNYEALYNQAMTHNAMLREALEKSPHTTNSITYTDGTISRMECKKLLYNALSSPCTCGRDQALNATGTDVEAWFDSAANAHCAGKIKAIGDALAHRNQQLATVTNELEVSKKQTAAALEQEQHWLKLLEQNKQQLATVTAERGALEKQKAQYKRLLEEAKYKIQKAKESEAAMLRRYQNLFSRVHTLAQKGGE